MEATDTHKLNSVNRLNEVLSSTYVGQSPSALIADIIHFAECSGLNFDDILRQGRVVAYRERDAIVKHYGTNVYVPLPQDRRSSRRGFSVYLDKKDA